MCARSSTVWSPSLLLQRDAGGQRDNGEEIGWILSLHGGSDEGGGDNVNNFMTTWRIRFPDGGMRTGMMSPHGIKFSRPFPLSL
nr:unnamed protein product [Digitaria exilis]